MPVQNRVISCSFQSQFFFKVCCFVNASQIAARIKSLREQFWYMNDTVSITLFRNSGGQKSLSSTAMKAQWNIEIGNLSLLEKPTISSILAS